ERFCQGGLRVFETTTPQLSSSSYLRIRVLDTLGNPLLGPYTGNATNPIAASVPAAAIASLDNGNYIIRAYKFISGYPYLDTCTYVDKTFSKQIGAPNLTLSKFIPGCPGGTG